MRWVWFVLKLPLFLLLAPVVWLLTRAHRPGLNRPPEDTWIAFANWLHGAPSSYRYPREDDEIDLRPYDH